MKQARRWGWPLVVVALTPLLVGFAFPGSVQKIWRQADRAYKRQQFPEAARLYGEAGTQQPQEWALKYNQAVAAAQAQQYDAAVGGLQQVAQEGPPELRAAAEYNTGNAYLAQKENEKAIEHYKRALYLRPDDMNAKWNLELARRKQQQQQQQQKQQQEKQQQQKQPQQKQEPDKQQQQQPKQPEKQQQPQPQPSMQKEEAQRLLQSLGQQDRDLQKRLQQQRYRKGDPVQPSKDW